MKWLESTFIKRDLGVSVDCKLNMNHHLDTAQRETPYWDYKQKYNLRIQKEISQLSSALTAPVNVSLLVGNAL